MVHGILEDRLALIHVSVVLNFTSSTVLETIGQPNDAKKILIIFVDHCDLHIMVTSFSFVSSTLFNSYALD